MSIFGSIMNKIFHHGSCGVAGRRRCAGRDDGGFGPQRSRAQPRPREPQDRPPGRGDRTLTWRPSLSGMSSKAGQQLDWRHSIVDLMKLLDLDSSLRRARSSPQELHYTGDMNDSASMNIWLHKQVMQKLAENGGKVPDSLRT